MFLIKLIVLELSTIIFIPKRSIGEMFIYIISIQSFENAVFIAKEVFHLKRVVRPSCDPVVKNLHFHCRHDFDPLVRD